jgi:drug/metabolite transporter (DMT)-like permease
VRPTSVAVSEQRVAATKVRSVHLTAVDATLIVTVVLWSLILTAQKYALDNGVGPLPFAILRITLTAAGFTVAALVSDRSLWISRPHLLRLIVFAGLGVWLNQLCLTYALHFTTASTVALLLGAIPIFGLGFAAIAGLDRVTGRGVIATLVSLAGVALVALGSGSGLSLDVRGDLLSLGAAGTWAGLSVALVPLIRVYGALRIGALTFAIGAVPLWLTGFGAVRSQDFGVGWFVWLALVYTGLSLVVANALWFRALDRVGPARATLFGNLQPFIAATFAVVLLSESLAPLQLLGGVGIALGIVIASVHRRAHIQPELP